MEACKKFEEVLFLLKLESYFPCKITLRHVLKAKLNDKIELGDIKWKILNKIINVDLRARDGVLSDILDIIKKQDIVEGKKSEIKPNDQTQKEEPRNRKRQKKQPALFHPQDVFNAIYLCCSPFLKQLLVSKLFMCRIAVPVIISSTQLTAGFLWPFNFVDIYGINSEGKVFECFLSDQDIQIVSFIRLGETTFSKSVILNNVMSKDQFFHTFYSRDCPLGTESKRTLNGTVEASYFIPYGQTEAGSFDDAIIFLNLRGDAAQYHLQLDVIKSVSTVVVVQLQTMKLQNDDNIGKTLHSIYQSSSSVIILLESNLNDDEEVLLDVKLNEIAESTNSILYCIDLKENDQYKGMNEIVKDTKSDILECISNVDCIQFSRFGQVLDNYGIPCDYAEKECFDGCQLADKMFEVIDTKSASIQHFWIELSKLKKTKYREKSLPRKRDIEKQIQQIRSRQLKHISHLPKMSSTMLQILYDLKDFPDKLMFFLKSLKLLLDKRSKKILPGLLSSLNDLSNDIKKAGSDKNLLERQTRRIKIEIEDASFGVEHLMREVAQIFEALTYAPDKEWCNVNVLECVKNCPSIAANLLIEGYSLEVMDGAASDVPLVWIKEVFRCLESKIGSTSKLLTLSIMGIQSSGKSTLLNAMFGLQLAVSTGRCTKGVFLQLIPMPKDQFPFQYVLVFDTEGLRSNEYRESNGTYVHDNQLATFVTGVGDITLINIRGENLSEVSDILEIVVHAFIRMKKVNANFELKQSCIFVHQDVADTNAERNLLPGTLKLVKCLDEITNEAAEQEHLQNCHSFDKIIHFNHNKHVFYFPNLWLGSPPLCAINTKYSEKVDRLRQFIMSDISERRKTFFNVDEIWTKINDLWEAILSEDFVFSFRNGIELKAERTAESKFFELHRKLEITVSQFLLIDAESAFKNCESEDSLLNVTSKAKCELNEKLSARYENLKKEWTDFIENEPLRDVIIQWKQNRLNQLEIYKNEQEVFAVKEIDMMESRIRLEIRQRIILTPKEKEDWKYQANNVVEKCNEHPLDNDIIAAFKKLWSTDLSRFDTDSNREFSIDEEIWKIVLHYFRNDTLYLRNEQETFEQQWRVPTVKQLQKPKGCFKEIDITEIHLSGEKDKFETNRKIALTMANDIFSEIDMFVGKWENKRFNIVKIREIFYNFSQNYHKCAIEARDHNFSLTKNFKAMLAVYIAKYLVAFYQRLHDEFEQNSGLETKRKEYEATLLNYFRKIISEAMKLKHEKIRKSKEEEENRKKEEEEVQLRHQEKIKRHKVQAEAKMKAEKEQNDLEIEKKKRQLDMEMNINQKQTEKLFKEVERKRIHQEKILYEEQENTKKLDVKIKEVIQRREERERILKEEVDKVKLEDERQRQEREQDRSTALSITNIINETLTSHVFSKLQSKIVTKILKQFNNSKHKLIKCMLKDLAENEVFEDFYSYIHSTTSYAKQYIEKYTDKKLFTEENLYFKTAETSVNKLIDRTKIAVRGVTNVSNMDEWSTQITDKFKYITLENLSLVRYIHVSNFENLTNFIIGDLKSKKDSLICHFKTRSRSSVNWNTPTPYAEIIDKLWGCEECCPLCSEPCEKTTKNHGGVHECLHHKINGVSGWHVVDTNVLCIHTCEENVASDGTFFCNRNKLSCQEDPNHIIHEFRSYKTYDPAWYIDPDNNLSSKYWPWYLCRFEEEIKNKYKVKYPMLENDWKNISKQDAIESLSKKKKANKW
ncbi:interferon-induced very large GTPase 1-like [Mytilus edulis]|uniref:interferon-induced very large GTPase 1-like n=1 Tax=Mytilus edulis TaxID=6550 RepID=UPI0039F08ED6